MGAITPLNRWCNGAGGPGARPRLQFRYYAVVVWWVIAHYSPHGPMQIASSIRKPRPLRVSLNYIHPLPTTLQQGLHSTPQLLPTSLWSVCDERYCRFHSFLLSYLSIFPSMYISIDGTIGCGGIAGMWVTLARDSESQRLRVGLSTRPIAQYTHTHTHTHPDSHREEACKHRHIRDWRWLQFPSYHFPQARRAESHYN